jgi:hypothetical protein
VRIMQIYISCMCDGNSLSCTEKISALLSGPETNLTTSFKTEHLNPRETGTVVAHARVCSVKDEDSVLGIVHDNPPTSIRHICFAIGVQYGLLCFRISCALRTSNQDSAAW